VQQEIRTSAGTVRMGVHGEGAEGRGRSPLVLLHANLHDRHDYDLVVERLARERQVFAAARLALRRPDRVTGLVLANTGGFYAPAGIGRQLCRLLGTPAVSRRVRRGFIPGYMKAANDNDRAVQARAVAKARTREGAAVAAGIWRSFLDPAYDLTAEAGNITAETLLVWGAKDPILPLREGGRVQTLIPGSTPTVLQTGHVTFSSDPDGFLAAVEPFIERIRA
jgi:pimeloyl-ACP methyl ester carboxylesterase